MSGSPGRRKAKTVVDDLDLLALGETMLSLVAIEGAFEVSPTFQATHGGAESNVCVQAARLGLRTAWIGRLGAGPIGGRIERDLTRAGIDVRWVRRDPERPTGVMIRDTNGVVRYLRDGSAASAMSPLDLDDVPVEGARAVFVSGITALIGDGPAAAAIELLDRARGLKVVDPNLRARLPRSDRAVEAVRPLVERADVVLGGEAELQATTPGLTGEALARAWTSLGPREVVVRRGGGGVGARDPSGVWHTVATEPLPDVDPVGAGDAFDGGYLAARLAGAPVPEALAQACRCGAAVASEIGDTGAVPVPAVRGTVTMKGAR
jgi:2-dehydro-3-deoxygluconokinase